MQNLEFFFCEKIKRYGRKIRYLVVIFTDSIPVTSTGKYKRSDAKKYFEEYRTIQFKKDKNN